MSEDGKIVGLGNVFPDPSAGGHAAEVALIIEDEYQGRGIGKKLLQALLHLAFRLHFTEVVASVLAENDGMIHLLRATGLDWSTDIHDGIAYMRAPLPSPVESFVEVEAGPVKRARRAPAKKAAAKKSPARKAPAKKAPAKKSPARKAPAKKAAAKKSPARKAPAKKAAAKKSPARKASAPAAEAPAT
jgi:hypothetical protein